MILRRKKALRRTALFLAVALLNQVLFPTFAMALTGGPSQPEVQGFSPVGTSDMVDLFTGDFQYNIPLMDVDGYPLNLSYQAGASVEDEASWVGLGWSLNPGVINRQMRGIPDDFKGDEMSKEFNIKEDETYSVAAGIRAEVFGLFGLGATKGISYNTYRGFNFTTNLSPSLGSSKTIGSLTANLGYSGQGGLDVGLSAGLNFQKGDGEKRLNSVTLSGSYNSRAGLKSLNLGANFKKKIEHVSTGHSGTLYSFGDFSYTPTGELPLFNEAFSFHANLTGELFGIAPGLNFNGFISKQYLPTNQQSQPTYGTLHSKEGSLGAKNVLDFNWSGRDLYRPELPNIPFAYGTYDIFAAAGQGLSGTFKATRNDVGTLRDAYTSNLSVSTDGGLEVGGGNAFHAGADINSIYNNSSKGLWEDGNRTLQDFDFTETEGIYESVFFKSAGEKTISDPTFYNEVGGFAPIRSLITKEDKTVKANRNFERFIKKQKVGVTSFNEVIKKDKREKRNQVFSYLTAAEAEEAALDKEIKSYAAKYTSDPTGDQLPDCEPAVSYTRTAHGKAHHISEITVTQGDGSRYVYGIPAYNRTQREVAFSVEPSDSDITASHRQMNADGKPNGNFGLIPYDTVEDNSSNPDNSIKNKKGKDHYFNAQNIPEYAHSYLLTAVLSPDYQDLTGDGVTNDDPGTAVKLNYSKVIDDYRWRVPFQEGMARYQEGYQSNPEDDKASYLYGSKEIWYLHSIESRTMVAQFILEDRNDALGVIGEDGGVDNNANKKMKRLKRIDLYTKADINDGNGVTPIKSVHFYYDYLSCSGVPNAVNSSNLTLEDGTSESIENAKLTLTGVKFSYGNSNRGFLNAYKFGYKQTYQAADGEKVAMYNSAFMDRWGNYKMNPSNYPDNTEFPYTIQDGNIPAGSSNSGSGAVPFSDQYAGSWCLNKIDLPSGGQINVEYEADDYAYVQDKPAAEMMFIQGFSDTKDGQPNNQLYDRDGLDNYTARKYMSVQLPQPVADKNEFFQRYIGHLNYIYFNCYTKLRDSSGDHDHINGYVEFDRADSKYIAAENRMVISLKPFEERRKDVHPIAQSAFQTLRLYLPQLYYRNYDGGLDNALAIKKLLGFADEIKMIFRGPARYAMGKKFAKTVQLDKSWVKLLTPDGKKYGGGCRVKKLTVSDQWKNSISSQESFEYGQVYDYTINVPGTDEFISSGVASYEPGVGSEENTLREPLPYKQEILLAPDNSFYTEKPVGEVLYPSPSVGYSEVKVRNIEHAGVERTATGYSVNKFYTAKDFPVYTDFTIKDDKREKSGLLNRFFKIKVRDIVGVSQGFTVETNDMHGKPREEAVYNQQGAMISSSQYFYQVENESSPQKRLTNLVPVIQPDGSITKQEIGVDTDVWHGVQEEKNYSENAGIAFNTDGFFAFIAFPIIPTAIPMAHNQNLIYRAMTTTKLIKRSGLLDRVRVTENGSTLTTYNRFYDSETGNVLLTETQNEFDDPVYQFGYPAHWMYPGMEQAYQNIHATFQADVNTDGEILQAGTNNLMNADYLFPGDEVLVDNEKYYVAQPIANKEVLLDMEGNALLDVTDVTIKVIRSGHRNQAAASVGSIMSLGNLVNNPVNPTRLQIDKTKNILQANASTFHDKWHMLCEEVTDECGNTYLSEGIINPYVTGLSGTWRPEAAFTFYDKRTSNTIAQNVNIRTGGAIENFVPFWEYDSGRWDISNVDNTERWTLSNLISMYDHRGNEVENIDAIGNYSSAYYGYNNNRVVAIASNAEKREITFDGLEDYYFDTDCNFSPNYKNFRFFDAGQQGETYNLDDQISHSGLYSIRLKGNTRITIKNNLRPCNNFALPATDNGNNEKSIPSRKCFSRDGIHIENDCSACLPKLHPDAEEEYYASVWVASEQSLDCNVPPLTASLNIGFDDGSIPQTFEAVGPTIDGWQRIEARFTIPQFAEKLIINISNLDRDFVYFDDFRFHPWESYMNAYVYDPNSMRLMAELDENNYASFYEYDDEGILVRVKRETEAGIVTIQEARTVLKTNSSINE